MQWIQNSNAPCQQTVHVCGFDSGPQNNWLITQLINRTVNGMKLSQVSVTIEFEQLNCDHTLRCQRTFNTHIFETSSKDSSKSKVSTVLLVPQLLIRIAAILLHIDDSFDSTSHNIGLLDSTTEKIPSHSSMLVFQG